MTDNDRDNLFTCTVWF